MNFICFLFMWLLGNLKYVAYTLGSHDPLDSTALDIWQILKVKVPLKESKICVYKKYILNYVKIKELYYCTFLIIYM